MTGKNGGGKINLILAIKDNAPTSIQTLTYEKTQLVKRVDEINKEVNILSALLNTLAEQEKNYDH
jgi:hypothetical protein